MSITNKIRYIPFPLGGAILALVLLFGLALFTDKVFASPTGIGSTERLITIHDQGIEQTIVTKATTVRGALVQAEISVQPSDVTEPSLDTAFEAKNYQVNVYRARPVTVVDGQKRVKVFTAEQSPRQIVAAAGWSMYDEDQTKMDRVDNVLDGGGAGLQLTIDRATSFTFNLYGKTFVARTQAATVGEMLKEKGIVLGAKDGVSLPASAGIVAGMTVRVWRDGVQTVTQEEAVPMPVRQVKDADKSIGYKAIQTPGKPGVKEVTYEINMVNGQEVSRREIQTVVTTQPTEQVEVVGVKATSPTENEAITWNYLLAHGYTRNQTAGIMGNLQQEHGFRTDGDGIVQWTGGRKANLMSRPDPYNIYTQLDFMLEELNGGYARANANIKASTSVEQAVVAFQNGYEGCGVCMQSNRIQFAYAILERH
jgi:uncharacterized protein YabE (DUF348 family)